jgi:hypothetical protein
MQIALHLRGVSASVTAVQLDDDGALIEPLVTGLQSVCE